MRRRGFVKALAAIPAAPALFGQARPTSAAAGALSDELPVLTPTTAELAAEPVPRFFTAAQFSALRKVSEILMPAVNGAPGALEAKVPEFLDFLIGESPAARKHLYQAGLDGLNNQAMRQFKKPFADLDATQADALMAPLRKSWTFEEPSDPVAAFLRAAKQDVRTATTNSREYSAGSQGGGGRRGAGGGGGLYWLPLE